MSDKNIVWHKASSSTKDRERAARQRGMVLWLTGLSGSGKSTIAAAVEKLLLDRGRLSYLLDGDNLRHGLNAGLGFSPEDREENIRRIAQTAKLFCEAGFIAVVSAISPYAVLRENARRIISPAGKFAEVFVSADIKSCIERDPKGLYKKALSGELPAFTGISSPYEEPENPDIKIDTDNSTPGEAASLLVEYVEEYQLEPRRVLERCCSAAVCAGNAIMEIYAVDFAVEYKEDSSPLTKADKASNEIIENVLRESFPFYPVLSEESADDGARLSSPVCFIVDPLDGTKEFIKKNGEFTVNIALSFKGEIVAGVIAVPAANVLYYAARGEGAFCYDYSGGYEPAGLFDESGKISVSSRTTGLLAVASRSHGDERQDELFERNSERLAGKITAGSSLKGCLVASGAADVYYRFGPTMEWDTAAMQCIAEQAGAIFRQMDGSEMRYNREDSRNSKGFYIINRLENAL